MSDGKIIKHMTTDGSCATIVASGGLNIENAGTFHQILAEAMSESQRVVLDARNVESVDITVLQTICAACKTAAENGVAFLFEDKLPDCMISLKGVIGAQMGSLCRQNNNACICIWFGGGR